MTQTHDSHHYLIWHNMHTDTIPITFLIVQFPFLYLSTPSSYQPNMSGKSAIHGSPFTPGLPHLEPYHWLTGHMVRHHVDSRMWSPFSSNYSFLPHLKSSEQTSFQLLVTINFSALLSHLTSNQLNTNYTLNTKKIIPSTSPLQSSYIYSNNFNNKFSYWTQAKLSSSFHRHLVKLSTFRQLIISPFIQPSISYCYRKSLGQHHIFDGTLLFLERMFPEPEKSDEGALRLPEHGSPAAVQKLM